MQCGVSRVAGTLYQNLWHGTPRGKEPPVYFPRPDTVSLVQARLEECLGPQRYKTWFKSSTQLTMADGLLKVSAATPFICEWIERNYADRIAEVAREVTGAEVQIAFAVEPKLLH